MNDTNTTTKPGVLAAAIRNEAGWFVPGGPAPKTKAPNRAALLLDAADALEATEKLAEALKNSPCYCEEGEGGEKDIVCDRCAALAAFRGEQP